MLDCDGTRLVHGPPALLRAPGPGDHGADAADTDRFACRPVMAVTHPKQRGAHNFEGRCLERVDRSTGNRTLTENLAQMRYASTSLTTLQPSTGVDALNHTSPPSPDIPPSPSYTPFLPYGESADGESAGFTSRVPSCPASGSAPRARPTRGNRGRAVCAGAAATGGCRGYPACRRSRGRRPVRR
jgi:hypothetical protein